MMTKNKVEKYYLLYLDLKRFIIKIKTFSLLKLNQQSRMNLI